MKIESLSEIKMRVDYVWIDIMKFLFALCIVAIHCSLFVDTCINDWITPLLLRLAVPFFFVASGFFVGLKCYEGGNYNGFNKWGGVIKRLIIKLIVFEPISIVIALGYSMNQGIPLSDSLLEVVKHIIFYPYGALWYVNALIVAIVLLIPAIKYKKEKSVLYLSIILYFISLLFNRYNFVIEDTLFQTFVIRTLDFCYSLRNGLFVGLMFVGIGVLLAKYLDYIRRFKNLILKLAILSYLILLLETILIKDFNGIDDNSLYISYIVLIPLLFSSLILIPSPKKWNCKIYRNMSTSIYFMHRPIMSIIGLSLGKVMALSPLNLFIITLSVCLLVCFPIYKKKVQPLFQWIT